MGKRQGRSATPQTEEPEEKVVSIVKKSKKGMDNISEDQMVKAVRPYCPEDLLSVKTSQGALSRSFNFGEYNAPHKTHLQIRGYVDFYGGYAKHTREVIKGLESTGRFSIGLQPIPSPRDIDPVLANQMDWYTHNPGFRIKQSKFMAIAGPGHLQQSKVPQDGRYKIGWTMIETRKVQPEITDWLMNMDEIYAPTQVDVKKFNEALSLVDGKKPRITWMPLGYDPYVWNPDVLPLDISNLRNRYVFGVLGSWNTRKSVKEIVQSYARTFKPSEPVSLLLCCKYGTRKWGTEEMMENDERWCIKWELEQYLAETGLSEDKIPHISIMDIPVHPEVMPLIAARFDALVGFSKGESTWLPGIEVGAMGKPVIQLESECSGFMDYLSGGRYMCKDVTYKEADEELYAGTSEYYKGEELAHGNPAELRSTLRRVYEERNSPEQRKAIQNNYDRIVDYTWDRTIKKLDRLHT